MGGPPVADWDAMTFEGFLNESHLDPAERMIVEIVFQIAACAPFSDLTLLNVLFAMHATGGYAGIGAVGSGLPIPRGRGHGERVGANRGISRGRRAPLVACDVCIRLGRGSRSSSRDPLGNR